ncbi:DDRGK domain-containing protein 1-like [Mercenaria mercenaria]|uniref:DDRGK domain-containing protein 1-like n=1 Tax=Mercenaria mercenaria TaxID=6596 RepID=UPI00234ED386|nr:DDRGK domain-containing protein 1-like [Mercenaria mercenaria]
MLPVSKGPQSTAAQITNLQHTAAQITSPQPTAAPTTSTNDVKETVTLTCEGEPEPKRAKLDAEESKRQYEMIAKVVEDSNKQLVSAIETNSRAIGGVDKTLGQFLEVLQKMNRTMERMGEEQRREHERRLEESQRREKAEATKRSDERDNRKETSKKNEGKENRVLKSTVKKGGNQLTQIKYK